MIRLNLVLERFPGTKRGNCLGRDLDDFLGVLGVSSFSCRSFPDFKCPETNELNFVPFGKGIFNGLKDRIHRTARFLLVEPRRLRHRIDQIRLRQTRNLLFIGITSGIIRI